MSSTGIILAGGQSSRFGTDKAFAKVGNSTLIESLLFPLSFVFKELIVVTNHPERYRSFPVKVVEDQVKGLGPLGGLYSGLLASDTERNFVVACDMPLVNPRLVRYLVSLEQGQVVVPCVGGKLEPLHAVYAKSCLPEIEAQLAAGELRIQRFFSKVDVRYIEEAKLRQYDPGLTSFLNINLQKDLKQISRLSGSNV